MSRLEIDEDLLDAVIRGTTAGLQIAGVGPKAIGCSKLPGRANEISVVIGMVGRRHGTVTFNISNQGALVLAQRILSTDFDQVNDDVLDAMGEITNIVAGKLKAELSGEGCEITNISCPSIVVGADYYMYHFRGFKTVSVEFELEEVPSIFHRERFFSTTLSLS